MDVTEKKIWFRAKKYGYGWYPVTWQGWVITLLYLNLITIVTVGINNREGTVLSTLISFGFFFIPATFIFLAICYHKGEVAKWRWGNKK